MPVAESSEQPFQRKRMKTYTSAEAAEELQIDVSRVLQLCRAGRMGGTKFGKAWVITAGEIARYQSLGPRASGRPKKQSEKP